jgi:hypothetical protein
MQKASYHGISVWFWPRDDPSVPKDVRDGADTIYPNAEWGKPDADFPCAQCDHASHFDAHQMIFDLTFCVCPLSYAWYRMSINLVWSP